MTNLGKRSTATNAVRGLKNSRAAQFVVIAALVVGCWALFVLLLSDSKPRAAKTSASDPGPVSVKAIAAPGEPVTDAQRWLYKAGDDLTLLRGRVAEGDAQNKELAARLQKLEEELKRGANGTAPTAYPPGTPSNSGTPARAPKFIPPPVPGAAPSGSSVPDPSPAAQASPPAPAPRGTGHLEIAAPAPGTPASPPGRAPVPADAPAATPATSASGSGSKDARVAGQTYLPIGFVKARLLGGLDAPTSGTGQSNPLPVFLHLEDLGWLPNHFRSQIRDCMVTAAAYGDRSSERALFRLERLSCVRSDRQVLEQNVSGSVFGEDGKLGLRGRLVTKQGQILGNALLAGVASGIGRGIVFQSSTTGVTALGTTVTQADPGKEFQTGVAQGVNSAMDRLAQYYISLAEQTFPVIEIDAQRTVDVAFTRGTTLDIPLPEPTDLLSLRGFE